MVAGMSAGETAGLKVIGDTSKDLDNMLLNMSENMGTKEMMTNVIESGKLVTEGVNAAQLTQSLSNFTKAVASKANF